MNTLWKILGGIVLAVLVVGIVLAAVKYLVGVAIGLAVVVGLLVLVGRYLFRDREPQLTAPDRREESRRDRTARRELMDLEKTVRKS